jgi:peroxiredoxin
MKNIILILLVIVGTTTLFAQNHQGSLVKTGEQSPNFSITSLDGKEISLSDLKGKVVLINFFATWCGPCMKELPEVETKLWPKFKDQNFAMISIGREHTKEQLQTWNEKKSFSFPLAPDPKREVYAKFASQYIPRNFILDKAGKIIWQGVGFNKVELEQMMKMIQDNL